MTPALVEPSWCAGKGSQEGRIPALAAGHWRDLGQVESPLEASDTRSE